VFGSGSLPKASLQGDKTDGMQLISFLGTARRLRHVRTPAARVFSPLRVILQQATVSDSLVQRAQ
jgi:hypothetical protein